MAYDDTLTFFENVEMLVTEYGVNASKLSVNLAIETYKDLRHYPSDWDDEKILADMKKNIAKIAMATVEIDSKEGVEGQTGHAENNVTRQYASSIMAYQGVCGYANAL